MDFSNYKFRASSMGLLMTNSKSKSDPLSVTTKKHLLTVLVNERYGRQYDISSKYIEKGLQVEEDSITLYSRYKRKFFKKNDQRITNDYFTGEPDLFEGEDIMSARLIVDIKSSWDIFTFFANLYGGINSDHYWQLQTYMALTGASEAILAYCLSNTPLTMILDEQRKLLYKMNVVSEENEIYKEACQQLEKAMTFDDIPIQERVIEIPVSRNDEDIEKMAARVIECRSWLNNFVGSSHFVQPKSDVLA